MRVQRWSTTAQMDVLGNGGIRGSFRQKLRQSQKVGDGDRSEQVGGRRGEEGVEGSDQPVPRQ